MSKDDDYDFGFTFEDEENVVVYDNEINDLKKRLQSVEKIIIPLLENLSKDPDKPIIKWPNRKPIIDKQIVKIKSLCDV